jgi:drug/metabolite transporter (DMT)-like permease
LILRTDLKKTVYDSIERKYLKYILFNVFSGVSIFILLYFSLSSLPLVEVTLMLNTVGLMVAVIAYFMLGDRLSIIEVACLIIAFGGVVTLILGAEANPATSHPTSTNAPTILAYILCLFACVVIAFHAICFRLMKAVNKWVIAFYMGLLGVFVFFAGIVFDSEGISWFVTFFNYPA